MTQPPSPNPSLAFLRERLQLIYTDPHVAQQCYEELIQVIRARSAARQPALKALDAQRAGQSDWYCGNRLMAYSAYVDKFAGNLKGVQDKIPHLKSLGVNYLHLLPFLQMRPGQNDGGFAVENFLAVEPKLGSIEDLSELTAALRAEGISLCSDLVLNHVADTHAWALAAKAGDPDAQAMFHWVDDTQRQAHELSLPQIFPQTAPGNFVWVPETQRFVWSTFYQYQWDLNYSNPKVLVAMIDTLLALANLGVEVFRLDSAAFLWKRANTNCMNQAECHWILQCFRAAVDLAAPAVLLKAEAIVPTAELPPYFGQGDAAGKECHLAYQSSLMAASWYALANQDAGLMNRMVRHFPSMSPDTTWITYARCHDDIGWNVLKPELLPDEFNKLRTASQFFSGTLEDSYARGISFQASDPQAVHGTNGMLGALTGFHDTSDEDGFARYRLMTALMFSTAGIPMVYMGDEYAQGNNTGDPSHWTDTRDLHRPKLEVLESEGTHQPTKAHKALAWMKKLRRLHLQHLHARNSGALEFLASTESSATVFAFRNANTTCLFNFSGQPTHWNHSSLKGHTQFTNLLDDTSRPVKAEGIELQPYDAVWWTQA